MLLCCDCRSLLDQYDGSNQDEEHCQTRAAQSFIPSAYNCRLCTRVWTVLHQRSEHSQEVWNIPIYLSLRNQSKDGFDVSIESEGKGGTWVLGDKYYKVRPEGIRAFLAEHNLKDDPRKYLVDGLCTLRFQKQQTRELLESSNASITESQGTFQSLKEPRADGLGSLPLGFTSPPVEFFKRFLPQLREWLHMCDAGHEPCMNHKKAGFLPTRLIRVGEFVGDAKLCVRSQVPPRSRYLTMSYRWGEDFVRLSKATFNDWLNGIPEEKLPLTIRDGITACRLLGYEYIWIDAICIIQDDREDWIRESAQMSTVYSGSCLNLAASGARNAHDGLFRRCNELCNDGGGVEYTSSGGDVFMEATSLSDTRYRQVLFQADYRQAPLHKRGWVLQELQLSVRTLHFLDTTFWWQCKSCVTFGFPRSSNLLSEQDSDNYTIPEMNFADATFMTKMKQDIRQEPVEKSRRNSKILPLLFLPGWTWLIWRISFRSWYVFPFLLATFLHGYFGEAMNDLQPERPERPLLDEWLKLVSLYTQTRLTHESDRQVAIAGLASRFATRFEQIGRPAAFHAGLWSHDFLIELLWQPWSGAWRFEGKPGCPSWSPLYRLDHLETGLILSTHLSGLGASYKATFEPLADVLEIATPPRDPVDSPFGPVRFGRVGLRAWTFEATVPADDWHSQREGMPLLDIRADVAYKMARPEVDVVITDLDGPNGTSNARSMACSSSTKPFLFVVLGIARNGPDKTGHQGLVLVEAPADYEMMPDDRPSTQGGYWIRVAKWTQSTWAKPKDKENVEKTTAFIKSITSKSKKRVIEII